MKKFSFILLLNLLALSFCLAAPRSYQQARQIALQKAASLGISSRTEGSTFGRSWVRRQSLLPV